MSGTGIPGQPFLPARTPKTSEGRGAGKQHWDQGGCRHVSSLGSSGSVSGWEQLRGFVPSVGMGRPCCVQSNRRCLLSSLPPCCLRPPQGGAVCAGAPRLGTPQLGPRPAPSPGGSGAIWHHALRPPRDPAGGHSLSCTKWHRQRSQPHAVAEAAAAPRMVGLQPAAGSGGQRWLRQNCAGACHALAMGRGTAGGTRGFHKGPSSNWGN